MTDTLKHLDLEAVRAKYPTTKEIVDSLGDLGPSRLAEIRSILYERTGVKDESVSAGQSESAGDLFATLEWEQGADDNKPTRTKDEEIKIRGDIDYILSRLKELNSSEPNVIDPSYYFGDGNLATLYFLLNGCERLGINFDDIFQGIDPEIPRVIEIKAMQANLATFNSFVDNPYAKGVFRPGSEHTASSIELLPFRSEKHLFSNPDRDAEDPDHSRLKLFKNDYPEIHEEILKAAKKEAAHKFWQIVLRNCEFDRRNAAPSAEAKIPIAPWSIDDHGLVQWLRDITNTGLSVKDVTGKELTDIFDLEERGKGGRKLTKEEVAEMFSLLERSTKPWYSVEKEDPDLAENHPGSWHLDNVIAFDNLKRKFGVQHLQAVLRTKIPLAKFLKNVEGDGNFEWPEDLHLGNGFSGI